LLIAAVLGKRGGILETGGSCSGDLASKHSTCASPLTMPYRVVQWQIPSGMSERALVHEPRRSGGARIGAGNQRRLRRLRLLPERGGAARLLPLDGLEVVDHDERRRAVLA